MVDGRQAVTATTMWCPQCKQQRISSWYYNPTPAMMKPGLVHELPDLDFRESLTPFYECEHLAGILERQRKAFDKQLAKASKANATRKQQRQTPKGK